MSTFHGCMIAGTHSGAGKTTVMFALEMLLRQKGLIVQPFKGGPDYIDPGFHDKASGRKCRNLDLFMLSPEAVKESFARNSQSVDFSLIEGMMGLYDGKDIEKDSSAALAKLLGVPVVLVVDGAGMAGSAAAVVLGFQKMDPAVHLAGVIFNRVNHDGHFQYLKKAVEAKTGVPCLGFLPREATIAIPERHLGLTTVIESTAVLEKISHAAVLIQKSLNLELFMQVTRMDLPHPKQVLKIANQKTDFRVGVAYDEAFSFYYEDNFDALKAAGAEICFFSPLQNTVLPEDLALLYLGGGFPELYAGRLAANRSLIKAVRDFHESGGRIYAECGGLMYLAEVFYDKEGKEFAMAGLIPGKIRMAERLQNFGYHELETVSETFLFPAGKKLRSHEFHHSVWDMEGKVEPLYSLGTRREGFAGENLIASYQHLHFGSDTAILDHLKVSLVKLASR